MPLFGAHMSIAGGLHNALLDAHRHECQTVQLFSKNASQWRAPDLSPEAVELFRQTLKKLKLRVPLVHDSYLINLASPDPVLYRRSIEAFVVEVERAERIGASYLVTHPGAAVDGDVASGLSRVATALDEVHRRCAGYQVRILLETTAGQGTTLGHRFEHLAGIIAHVAEPDRLGVCLDTCHVFAAGYPLAPNSDYAMTMKEFDRVLGLGRLEAFHLNDSRKPLGSRVDRHAHIGQGCLGLEPFRLLVNDRRFRRLPMILETPKEGNMDAVNLATLRELLNS